NDIPDDFFLHDSRSNGYLGYSSNQPELTSGTVEFVASVEYMVRPPQPAAYLFVFDCSAHAYHLGYLPVVAKTILDCLRQIPGDSRTLVGFIGFDSKLHFFNLGDKQPLHLVMPDIQDVFLPSSENLLVNLQAKMSLIEEFLSETLPKFPFVDNVHNPGVVDSGSALGPALTAAYKVISSIGGRVTVFQAALPNQGSNDGSILSNREDPNSRTTSSSNSSSLTPLLNPVTDFYKKLALDFNEHQVAVDLFSLCHSYSDLATVGQISKISGGSVYYYGGSGQMSSNSQRVLSRFERDLRRYLTRNVGFEAVMRLRCTRGLSIHTFHGNFFVRSTDLLALPNVNPDSGFAMQLSIDEDIKDFNAVCFQAAVLYTNAVGERRIRVHTLSIPVVSNIADVVSAVDQEAVVSLLAKMAVDRSLNSSIADSREALLNAVLDLISTYRNIAPFEARSDVVICHAGRLIPLYISALLKHPAFRVGLSTKVDERVYSMEKLKTLPICYLMNFIYPNLYPLHFDYNFEAGEFPRPVQLSFANIERNGVYLLDTFDCMYLYICKSVHPQLLADVFGVSQWSQIPDDGDSETSSHLHTGNPLKSSAKSATPAKYQHNTGQQHINSHNSVPHKHSQNMVQVPNGYPTNDYSSNVIPIPKFDNRTSKRLHALFECLLESRPFTPHFFILRFVTNTCAGRIPDQTHNSTLFDCDIYKEEFYSFYCLFFQFNCCCFREDSRLRYSFLQYMYDDRNEAALSYYEFLQHIQQQLKS
ncbi:hypothetical protein B4U80_00758, partial [Leptotrombidium deliense]